MKVRDLLKVISKDSSHTVALWNNLMDRETQSMDPEDVEEKYLDKVITSVVALDHHFNLLIK